MSAQSNLQKLLAAKKLQAAAGAQVNSDDKSTSIQSAGNVEVSIPSVALQPQVPERSAVELAGNTAMEAPIAVEVVTPQSSDPRVAQLQMDLAELRDKLNQQIPDFPVVLKRIHTKLRADPEIVTLMSEDAIRLVVSGLQRHAQVEVVAPAVVKSAKKAIPKGTAISADML